MFGSVVSTTVTFTLQVSVLPAASVAVIVTAVTPSPIVVPAVGDCVIVGDPVQLSVAVTLPVRSGIVAWQDALALILLGVGAQTVMFGSVVSTTVTSKLQVSSLSA